MKTKEQIRAYNKEYFARPDVIARAKIRNAKPEHKLRRKLYKKTKRGRLAENSYRRKRYSEIGDHKRFIRYGITPEEYKEILNAQDGVCAICRKKTDKVLHIDHCHKTHKVRGILCSSCNMGLGLFHDDVRNLNSAIEYLNAVRFNKLD